MALASFCIVSDYGISTSCSAKISRKVTGSRYFADGRSQGHILTYEMSRLLGKEFVVARKTKKPYMQNVLEAVVYSITTQKKQTLYLDGCDVEKIKENALPSSTMSSQLENLSMLWKSWQKRLVQKWSLVPQFWRSWTLFTERTSFSLKEHYVFTPNEDGTFTPIECETKTPQRSSRSKKITDKKHTKRMSVVSRNSTAETSSFLLRGYLVYIKYRSSFSCTDIYLCS